MNENVLAFCRKTSGGIVKIPQNVFKKKTFSGIKIFFGKKISLLSFLDLERTFGLLSKVYPRGCENCMLCVHTVNFMAHGFLLSFYFIKIIIILIFIKDLERNFFWLLKKNYRWGCEKCIPHIHSNILMKFFFETSVFQTLLDIGQRTFGRFSEIFRRVETIVIYVSIGIFSGVFLPKNINKVSKNFGHWMDNFWQFVESLSASLWKLHSICP